MLTYVRGNLFSSPAQVLTNAVNCVGVMGAGIALDFKNRFPVMFDDYKRRCTLGEVVPGRPYLWENDEVQILNFPTKRHWKDPSQIEDIEAGLQYLATHYTDLGIATLALPPLGCGLGGLSWSDVKPMIEKYLGPIQDLDVFVYEPTSSASSDKDSSSQRTNNASQNSASAASSPRI